MLTFECAKHNDGISPLWADLRIGHRHAAGNDRSIRPAYKALTLPYVREWPQSHRTDPEPISPDPSLASCFEAVAIDPSCVSCDRFPHQLLEVIRIRCKQRTQRRNSRLARSVVQEEWQRLYWCHIFRLY